LGEISAILPIADPAAALSVEVFPSLAAAEGQWRLLETYAVLTPYQRFDWIDALLSAGGETDGKIAVAVISRGERVVALLPLIIDRKFGIASGRLIGSHLTNSDWMIVDPAARFDQASLSGLLDDISVRAGGLDLVSFCNLPSTWQGIDNPLLAFAHEPAPNNLYYSVIGPTPAPYIEHRLNQKRRANIRRGARRLEEMFGKVELRRVNDAAELDKVHATFLRQRAERFDQMGVTNIFAEDYFVRFFRTLAIRSFNTPRPALAFHALYAGDEIVATCIGAFSGNHYSQYINSTDSGPASKYSLMGVLMADLCDELNAVGVVSHDMGIGDFEYKTDWTEAQIIYNSVVPITARGKIVVPMRRLASNTKRAIKQNQRIWALAQVVLKAKYEVMKRLKGR
jgi:CelD/BcsL family acetyltransferase involved in cellulose biosynthesis